ncbi:MAG: arylesterase [Burkholderiales bacterium]
MLRIFLFFLLSGTAGTAYATANILVFGDSISAGYGLARDQGWVDLLRARLARERFDYKVINASVSGETTTGGKARLSAALSQFQPHIVIIELGGNDGLRGGRLDTMRDNLSAMIADCRRHNSRILLVGMQVPPNYGNDYREKFRLVYDTLAKTQRVPQVSFLFEGFGDDRSLFQPDGIHPTAAAQGKLLDNVWPQLRPLLASRPAKH